jgi:hypothetical protein
MIWQEVYLKVADEGRPPRAVEFSSTISGAAIAPKAAILTFSK